MNTTMNTVNQSFNWSRFTAALRKEAVENWRAILFTLLGTYGLLAMLMILGNWSCSANSIELEAVQSMYIPQKVVWFFLSFAGIIIASLAFRKLTTKTGRIEMFTSPSSMAEKFLVNSLIYVIGYLVGFFICAQLADLTRIAVLWPFKGEYFNVPGPINFLTLIPDAVDGFGFGTAAHGNPANWLIAYMYIGLLAGPGLYLLGSVVWPRLSLLKTFAATYAVESVIGIIAMIAIFSIGEGNMESFGYWLIDHLEQLMTAMTFFYVLIAIVIWSLAWFLFKRKDVISLKWWK